MFPRFESVINKKIRKDLMASFLLLVLLFCIVTYLLPLRNIQVSVDDQTWVSSATYSKIVSLKNSSELSQAVKVGDYPIFVVYDVYAPELSYLENVIKMEIGNCYMYYGQLYYLLNGQATPQSLFNSTYEKQISEFYFGELSDSGVVANLNSHPLVIITPDFYIFDNYTISQLHNFDSGSGIYIIPCHQLDQVPFFDVLPAISGVEDQPENFYSYTTNWSYANRVLEFYQEKPGSLGCSVSYPLYLFTNNSTLKIRLYDAALNWGTIDFFIDNNLIGTYSYNGTGDIVWVSYNLPVEQPGLHTLRISLVSKDKAIMRLDIIVLKESHNL